jgi:hypothetical protein
MNTTKIVVATYFLSGRLRQCLSPYIWEKTYSDYEASTLETIVKIGVFVLLFLVDKDTIPFLNKVSSLNIQHMREATE